MSEAITEKLEKLFSVNTEEGSLRFDIRDNGNNSFSIDVNRSDGPESYKFLLEKYKVLKEVGLIESSCSAYENEDTMWDTDLLCAIRDGKKYKGQMAENVTLEVKPHKLFSRIIGQRHPKQLDLQIDFSNKSEADILAKLDEAIRRATLDHTLEENMDAGSKAMWRRQEQLSDIRQRAAKMVQKRRHSNDEKDVQIVGQFIKTTVQEIIPNAQVNIMYLDLPEAQHYNDPGFSVAISVNGKRCSHNKTEEIIELLNTKIPSNDPRLRFFKFPGFIDNNAVNIEIIGSAARIAAEIEGRMPTISGASISQRG